MSDARDMLRGVKNTIESMQIVMPYGTVDSVQGSKIVVTGLEAHVSPGSHVRIEGARRDPSWGEVISVSSTQAIVMPYASSSAIMINDPVYLEAHQPHVMPHKSWLGRVINGLAQPIDGAGGLAPGGVPYALRATPLPAHKRRFVQDRIDLGVRAMNTFTTCCRGQRMGIFSGSGVGKSILLSMLAKFARADVIVIGLIGERGREVREFIDRHLGPAGKARSVTVVSTSDETALMRRRAAYTTVAVAEYFRDQGCDVLLMMDSVTRFATALREIGLARGEPPTTKGFTPNVFAELPQLLERSGPGLEDPAAGSGNITALVTILVEGDDTNEPVSDTVRGILDGHIILDRAIAERGRFPAVNVLKSLSRTMPDCNTAEQAGLVQQARGYLSTYDGMEELIRLGAYRRGSSKDVDDAIFYATEIEKFLTQDQNTPVDLEMSFHMLQSVLAATPKAAS